MAIFPTKTEITYADADPPSGDAIGLETQQMVARLAQQMFDVEAGPLRYGTQ